MELILGAGGRAGPSRLAGDASSRRSLDCRRRGDGDRGRGSANRDCLRLLHGARRRPELLIIFCPAGSSRPERPCSCYPYDAIQERAPLGPLPEVEAAARGSSGG